MGSFTESGEEQVLIMRSEQQKWVALESETPEAEDMELIGISCNVAGSCQAVGYYVQSGKKHPLAMHSDGFGWWTEAVPSLGGKGSDTHLTDVSCVGATPGGATRCVAVGVNENGAPQSAVSAIWNGEKWSAAAPEAPGALKGDFALQGVSCISESECYVGGSYEVEGGETRTLIEKWDGAKWTISASSNPEGNPRSGLSDVECVAVASDCVAVGSSSESASVTDTLAMHQE